ncbi:MAG: hypothetical protein ACLUVC_01465 [Longibaculum sp.]
MRNTLTFEQNQKGKEEARKAMEKIPGPNYNKLKEDSAKFIKMATIDKQKMETINNISEFYIINLNLIDKKCYNSIADFVCTRNPNLKILNCITKWHF